MRKKLAFLFFLIFINICFRTITYAEVNQVEERINYYHEYAFKTNLSWNLIAAIDQYERNTKNYRSYCPKEDEVISVCIDPKIWSGVNNPIIEDNNPLTINMFHGMGIDANEDGFADRLNPHDRLYSLLTYIIDYGYSFGKVEEALFNYYNTDKGVQIIFEISKLFKKYNTFELSKRVFPIPKYYIASWSNNFGTARSYGGYRSHEGIDIFAHYGTPVVSTAYGIIEIMGWNNYGGYRIGIRDMYNTYEYYAHLNKYAPNLKVGDIVEVGQVIGYVGSTGYGKEKTSGKFPPHLHFGFYKFDGKKEWSFNPYPYLKRWEKIKL